MLSEKMRRPAGMKQRLAEGRNAADVEQAGFGVEANLARVAGQVAEAAGFGDFAGVLVHAGREVGAGGLRGEGQGCGGGGGCGAAAVVLVGLPYGAVVGR